MPLYKSSQMFEDMENFGDEDEVVLYEELPSKEDVIEMHEPGADKEIEISFKLPALPGSDMPEALEVSTDDAVEIDEDDNKTSKKDKNDLDIGDGGMEVLDPWDWPAFIKKNGPQSFTHWVKERFSTIPMHNGETVGVERAISYLKKVNSEISKAISNDYDGKISVKDLEVARREIYGAIDRLEKYLQDSKKKTAGAKSDLVKEAGTTKINGIIITVPLHISAIARACINGTISAGKDIEKLVDFFIKKYALTDRDQMELTQLIADMGFPMRRDRGLSIGEAFDPTSEDNVDYAPNYPS